MLYSMVVHCTVNRHMCLSGIQPPSRAQQRLDSLNLKTSYKVIIHYLVYRNFVSRYIPDASKGCCCWEFLKTCCRRSWLSAIVICIWQAWSKSQFYNLPWSVIGLCSSVLCATFLFGVMVYLILFLFFSELTISNFHILLNVSVLTGLIITVLNEWWAYLLQHFLV